MTEKIDDARPRLTPPRVSAWLDGLVPERPAELAVMEAYARESDFPIIGPAVGQLCYMLARTTGARRIFELGSGYGYSTAWFARAVAENGGGCVHHVVWDEDLSARARRHLETLGLIEQVDFRVAEAVGELDATDGPFDIIFNDIDKQDYPSSLAVIERKLRPGGLLIVDNMYWDGRALDDSDMEPASVGVRTMLELLTTTPDTWTTSVLPIRDGVLVARYAG